MGKKKKNWNLIDTSLVSVLVAFQEVVVVVELRNETLVKGTLDEADQFMNVHMSNVTLTPFQVELQTFLAPPSKTKGGWGPPE
mmetsp:Transcript_39611/g.94040  ORF Transcript_39611/g.94040 Transcript_39611/m.94040 type:complete len:83 (-) Transcript_39611:449-697(-)